MTTEGTEPAPILPAPAPRRRLRQTLSWLLQGALLLAVYLAVSGWRDSALLAAGTKAPDFSVRSLGGQTLSLEDLRGKRVLIHFWATWCGVCKAEIGTLERLSRDLEPGEQLVTIVDPSSTDTELAQFLQEHAITYPVFVASPNLIAEYRVRAFPTNYFLSAHGVVDSANSGLSTRFGMRQRLRFADRTAQN